jgi:hypothetical protein
MAMESLNIMMAHFMKESGRIVSWTAKAFFSKLRIPQFSKEISKTEKRMALVFWQKRMKVRLKVYGKMMNLKR